MGKHSIKTFTLRMDAELYEMIVQEARKQGISRATLIEQMILERINPQTPPVKDRKSRLDEVNVSRRIHLYREVRKEEK